MRVVRILMIVLQVAGCLVPFFLWAILKAAVLNHELQQQTPRELEQLRLAVAAADQRPVEPPGQVGAEK